MEGRDFKICESPQSFLRCHPKLFHVGFVKSGHFLAKMRRCRPKLSTFEAKSDEIVSFCYKSDEITAKTAIFHVGFV